MATRRTRVRRLPVTKTKKEVSAVNHTSTEVTDVSYRLVKVSAVNKMSTAAATDTRRIVSCEGTRKRKRKRKKVVPPCLPVDIIFKILLFVPAETLYRVMRCVCREWNNIISHPSFISEQRLRAPTGIFIHMNFNLPGTDFLETTSGGELKLKRGLLQSLTLDRCNLLGSCHGLLMISKNDRRHEINAFSSIEDIETAFIRSYFVANPVTKQLVKLPDIDGISYPKQRHPAIGYAASVNAYKVVGFVVETITGTVSGSVRAGAFRILTLGVDRSWRSINAETIITDENGHDIDPVFCNRPPIWISGFIYWAAFGFSYVRCLNLDTELFQTFRVPKCCEKKLNYFIPMGDLFTMVSCSQAEGKFKVWVRKQVAEAEVEVGEWTKLQDIDIEHSCLRSYMVENQPQLLPICWLNGGEFLIFEVKEEKLFIFLDVKTQEVYLMGSNGCPRAMYPHLPSLVSI